MLIHRWMGVVFCVLFFGWFTSGIVLIYCRFPHVEPEDRLARAPAIDPSQIRVAPSVAFRSLVNPPAPSQLRMNILDGRPVYRFHFGRKTAVVFADDGQRFNGASQDMALRIASAWTGTPAREASFDGAIVQDDQWTLDSSVHPYGPFWKYSWPNGEQVYVSQLTGEVVQHTTRAARIGAYFGAIPHWLYFTWLRSHAPLWTRVVIWLSAAGTAMSILGLVAGVWLYSSSPGVPFTGTKRWHVILGLIFGLFTCTWIFSGLLSMGPFAWVSDRGSPNLERALRDDRIDPSVFDTASIAKAASVGPAKELEFFSFNQEPFYLATSAPSDSVLVPLRGDYRRAFNNDQIRNSIARAVAPASIVQSRWVTRYEPYYIDRENKKPLPVLYVELNDAAHSWFYIDPRTAKVVETYGARTRWNRWLYHGLHSMDLPALYAHRPAWDIVVLILLAGGVGLSVTSLVIAGKRLRAALFKPSDL